MGSIYSLEAVQSGRLPEPGAHQTAAAELLSELFEGADPDAFVAGLVCGSTANGSETIRSDLDIQLMYRTENVERARNLAQTAFAGIYERLNVQTEAHYLPVFDQFPNKTEPHFDGYLIEHFRDIVRSSGDKYARNNPMDYIATGPVSAEQQLALTRQYLAEKSEAFMAASIGDFDVNKLQLAFELPAKIGRKTLAVLGQPQGTAGQLLETEAANYDYARPGLAAHNRLTHLDRQYTFLLQETLIDRISPYLYHTWMETLYTEAQLEALRLTNTWQQIINRSATQTDTN